MGEGRATLRRFLRHRLAIAGMTFLIGITLAAILAPQIAPYSPSRINLVRLEEGPSSAHLLGTDQMGRDVLSRLLFGARVSLMVGAVTALITAALGTALGVFSGFTGGRLDSIIMRAADVFLSFPMLPLAIVAVAIFGPGTFNIVLVASALMWPGLARIVRGQCLAIREADYVLAAQAAGASERWIMWRHLLPNVAAPIIVWTTLNVAQVIILESGLSFLGLGVQIPTPTWGNMLTDAQSLRVLEGLPWLWLPPGLMIFATVMSINLVGDGLRDVLDPFLKGRNW